MNKDLTIAVLSYNHSKYILECLTSVVQINGLSEILIIDDGSTDNSLKIIREFKHENQHLNLTVISKSNAGLTDSLNIALDLCKTSYIYFIASDDIAVPVGVNEIYNRIKSCQEENIVIGGGLNFEGNSIIKNTYSYKTELFLNRIQFRSKYSLDKDIFLRYPHPILIQSTVFSVTLLKKVAGWEKGIINDDYQIFIKLFKELNKRNIAPLFNLNILAVKYRHHDSNSYKNILRQFLSIKQLILIYSEYKFIKLIALSRNKIYFMYQAIRSFQIKVFFKITFDF